jgi:hypothetical protein
MEGSVGKGRELVVGWTVTAATGSSLPWVVKVVTTGGRAFLRAIYIRLRYGDARLRCESNPIRIFELNKV